MASFFLSEDYLNKLSPCYRQELNKLKDSLEAIENHEKKQEILEEFSQNFLMPRLLWDQIISLYFFNSHGTYDEAAKEKLEILRKRAIYQFYYDRKGKFRDKIRLYLFFQIEHRKLLKTEEDFDEYRHSGGLPFIKMKEKQLEYPHRELERFFKFYERYSTKAPSPKLCKKVKEMKKLYIKIKDSENDVEKWIKCLKEAGDNEFVVHNIEYRLGKDLTDVKLWKLYIELLKEINPKEMLQAYSKYCRFFIDDQEMKENYQKEVEIHGPVFISWKNPFSFETIEPEIKELTMLDFFGENFELTEKICWNPKKPCGKYFFDTQKIGISEQQNFGFPRTLIFYILNNSNSVVLQRMYQTCKYFYSKKSMPICYNFQYTCSPRRQKIAFREESVDIRMDQNGILDLKNLYISNSLSFYYLPEINFKTLSKIIPSFKRCEPKHITIENQNITFEEFKFISGQGKNVETLNFKNVRITNIDGNLVALEDIMEMLPNIWELRLDNVHCTLQTSYFLNQMKFNHKFRSLNIYQLNDNLEVSDFYNFLKKNTDSKTKITLSSAENVNEDFIFKLKRMENKLSEKWDLTNKIKPSINVWTAEEYELLFLP